MPPPLMSSRVCLLSLVALVLATSCGNISAACACPFCSAPTLTLAEQFAQSDAVVLVAWVGAIKSEKDKPGTTTYSVVEAVRDPLKLHGKGTEIVLLGYRAGKAGDLSLLLGTKGTKIDWAPPIDVTETVFNYMMQAPAPDAPVQTRLQYFLKFLEYPEPTIATDAYAEFANAPYKDIVPLTDKFPRDKLRQWLASKETPESRLGLYGMLLGLCGEPEDAKLMEARIADNPSPQSVRLGIDGVMGGYLLLTREKGLEVLERTKMADRKVPFGETYAAMQAIRFMWTYGDGRIPPDRLRASLRILLDRPELADFVITDLSRWKDWSIADRLVLLFNDPAYDIPSVKRAIVRYFLACAKDMKVGETPPAHVTTAKKHIEALRKQDPKIVRQAEQYPI